MCHKAGLHHPGGGRCQQGDLSDPVDVAIRVLAASTDQVSGVGRVRGGHGARWRKGDKTGSGGDGTRASRMGVAEASVVKS